MNNLPIKNDGRGIEDDPETVSIRKQELKLLYKKVSEYEKLIQYLKQRKPFQLECRCRQFMISE